MHSYLKSIGFNNITRHDLEIILKDIEVHPDIQGVTDLDRKNDDRIVEFRKNYSHDMGIAVIGSLQSDGFRLEYYYPYFCGSSDSSHEDVEIVRMSDREMFQGILDDDNVGIDLVFHLIDEISIIHADYETGEEVNHGKVRLSGMCDTATVLFPLDDEIKPDDTYLASDLADMMKRALGGDVAAVTELSMDDLRVYEELSNRLKSEDVLTILSSYIMPLGIESDKYTVLGEIKSKKQYMNSVTHQIIWVIGMVVNGINIDVCVNRENMIGEPAVGMRLKCNLWLQGRIA